MHPYVISPAPDDRRYYRPNDDFVFDLLLFGRANEDLHYFIFAIDHIGEQGIGKKIGGHAARFTLTSVSAGDHVIYSDSMGKISAGDWTRDLGAELESAYRASPAGVSSLTVHILTPLRVKYRNHLEADLPFHVLIRAALRRVATLCRAYGAGEPALDYQGLVSEA